MKTFVSSNRDSSPARDSDRRSDNNPSFARIYYSSEEDFERRLINVAPIQSVGSSRKSENGGVTATSKLVFSGFSTVAEHPAKSYG